MKKSLIALAVVAASGAAMAQSSVTLFGVADAAVGNYKGATSATKMITSGTSSSRIGFRGIEDLGGGMYGAFWLEAGHNPDSGTGQGTTLNNQAAAAGTGNAGLTFNRRSTIDLGGSWGAIRLGRDYTPGFDGKTVFDPFSTLGVAQSSNLNGTGYSIGGQAYARASNSVQYLYGFAQNDYGFTGKGLYVKAMYAMGENASGAATSSDGNLTSIKVGYADGPLNVAGATEQQKAAAVGNYKTSTLGASYNIGVANLIAHWSNNKAGNGSVNNSTWLIGATIPVGAGYIPVSYNQFKSGVGTTLNNQKANQFGIGYVHNLSKRTALYGTYARLSNKNGASFAVAGAPASAVNGSSSGMEFGLKHSF